MKKIILVVIAVIIIVAGYLSFKSNTSAPVFAPEVQVPSQTASTETAVAKTYTISIADFAFDPKILTINKGDTIVWTNNDSVPHQIIGDNLNGQIMNKGHTFSQTFDTVGPVNYHCSIHPMMIGMITVR
ncbi:MAG: plastocyanin/azurin family copper-binding protein [bacterium]